MAKTHWKKIVSDPRYLGEADFQEGEEKVLTISRVVNSVAVKTAEGTSDKAVVYFAEKNVKPMILNVAKSKAIEKVSGSPYTEDWPGTRITTYIDHHVKAFGSIVSAVRVRETKPKAAPAAPVPLCAACHGKILGTGSYDDRWMAAYTTKHYGVPLCSACATKRKAELEAAKKELDDSKAGEVKPDEVVPSVHSGEA